MNINVRIRQFRARQQQVEQQSETIPPWPELQSLDESQVRELAERLGLEYTERMATLSAIHKAR